MRLAIALIAISLISTMAAARTWYIQPDGLGDAPTIQAGIDSAVTGDTVMLACGTYHDCTHADPHGQFNCIIMKAGIVLRSETDDPSCVTVDTEGQGRCLLNGTGATNTKIEGITFTNGNVGDGGGILCRDTSPTISNCNFLELEGGGINCIDASPKIELCSFIENHALAGGGIAGIRSSPIIKDCEFVSNSAADGGAIFYQANSFPDISDCLFEDNYAGSGGAICSIEGAGTIQKCEFRNNTGTRAAGIELEYYSNLTISECIFSNNISKGGGGGMQLWFECSAEIDNCTFFSNTASVYGGAINIRDHSDATIRNSTFFGNSADVDGGAIRVWESSVLVIENSVIAFSGISDVISCEYLESNPQISCSDLSMNEGGDWIGCIADQYGINGNFSSDPEFCHPISGDFTLCTNSPCLPGNHPDGDDCGLIGAFGEGCSGPSAVTHASWGEVKQLFR